MFLIVLLGAVLGGLALTTLLEGEWRLAHRLGAGALVGLALQYLFGFALASGYGMNSGTIAATAAVSALPAVILRRRLARVCWVQPSWPPLGGALYAMLVALMLGLVFDRAFFESNGSIATGVDHNLGDLPFHLAVVTAFAHGDNFPPEHPELAGVRLTYPFLVDFGAAMLVGAGASLRVAFLAQNVVLALALFAMLHRFALALTDDSLAARLAPLLLFLSGGLGFLLFLGEASRGQGVWSLLGHLTHDYTITRDGALRFGNSLIVLFMPQRALLLGAPLVLLVWILWWEEVRCPGGSKEAIRRMALAGAVAGLLPLSHSHAFAVTLAFGACLFLLFPRRAWLAFFLVAGLLALPQALWIAQGSSLRAEKFLAWQVGWDRGQRNALVFWWMNNGLFLPLFVLASLRFAPRLAARFVLPSWLFFIAPNLLRLSPWIWDNIKFLIFWFLAGLPLVAWIVARLLRGSGWSRILGAILLIGLTASGALDVWRVASRQITLTVIDRGGADFARELLARTPPRALILHVPWYDSPAALSGRRSLLGYPGHIWSQGLDAGSREADIARIYRGDTDAEALLRRHRVDFILVGPEERAKFPVNDALLARYPVVVEREGYALLEVR